MKKGLYTIKLFIYSIYYAFSRMNCQKVLSKKLINKCIINSLDINDLETYTLQGITCIDGYLLITAYDSESIQNSRVYIFKNDKLFRIAELNTKAHVGGICYDDDHKVIWITDRGGHICAYKYDDFFDSKKVMISSFNRIKISNCKNINNNNAVAYITYFNNKLYLGNYNIRRKSLIKVYDILDEGNINLDSLKEISAPDFIQGITLINKNNKTFLLISSSYGITKSKIKIYEYNDNIVDLNKEKYLLCKCSPMLEQISFDKEGHLLAVYESNSKKYQKYRFSVDDIVMYDINGLLNKFI